ncbi:MAG: two-component sensor histidine kinase, partial [Pseudomonadota bacterium]
MSERRPRRPPIRAVLILMLLIAVMTPMVGLFFFRVFENQLIRKTEAELIAQSAAIAAVYRREAQSLPDAAFGAEAPWEVKAGYFVAFSPYGASLDLASDPILPPRPEATPAPPLDPAYGAIGDALEPVIEETRRRTLA